MNKKRGPSGLTEEEDESDYVIEPPNGGWGWVIVFSAFYCNVVADGIQFTFGVFLNKIADEFEVDKSKIALVGSLMFGFHLIMGMDPCYNHNEVVFRTQFFLQTCYRSYLCRS